MFRATLRRHAVSLGALLLVFPAAPSFAVEFSDILPGAKAMGLGMAHTAIADDPYAMLFNPGGLAGTDFTSLSGSVGRMQSPVGPLSFYSMVYSRPLPLREDSVVGVSYFQLRESRTDRVRTANRSVAVGTTTVNVTDTTLLPPGGDKDQFVLHYSEPVKLPQLYLTKPLKVGANVKIVSVDGGSKGKKIGLGLDAGALAESNFGLKGGLAVLDLMQDIGVPVPTIALGLAYTRKGITMAGDLRVRKGLTEFYPGIEASFFQGLLKARAGKGVPLHGVSQVAFGVGVNFSPVVLDFAMTMPWAGSNREGSAYQAGLTYRFDAPPFYGRFIGAAARQAEDLKGQLLELEDKKRTLDAQVQASETTKQSVEGQLRSMEGRARSLQEQLRDLELKVDERKYDLGKPQRAAEPPAPVPAPKSGAVPAKATLGAFPRQHVVAAGDTLRSIAAKHYGDPSLWETIYNANPLKIDRGLPREGETLLIPAPARGAP